MSQSTGQGGKTKRVAYTIVERGEGKSFWLRVGNAFENRDGSLNVFLDAIPINGRLQIREYQPDDERDAQSGAAHGNGAHGSSTTTGERGQRGFSRRAVGDRNG